MKRVESLSSRVSQAYREAWVPAYEMYQENSSTLFICLCFCVYTYFHVFQQGKTWERVAMQKKYWTILSCAADTQWSFQRRCRGKKTFCRGFPGGAVVESLPANAGDTGSSPGLGGSHMPRSDWAREPQLLSLRIWSLCSPTGEAAAVRSPRTAMKSGPRLPQLEKALTQKRRPNTAINKINK